MVDIDLAWALFSDKPTWTFRRMWTHSLFMAPLVAVIGALLFSRLYRQSRFKTWLWVFLLGVSFHVAMDLINSYGVVLLFPFSKERFELAWVFIVDPYIWGILLSTLLLPRLLRLFNTRVAGETSARAGLTLLLGYILFCGAMETRSSSLLNTYAQAQAQVREFTFQYVFPEPFGPWNFRGVLRSGDEYSVFLVQPMLGKVSLQKTYFTDESDADITKLVQSDSGETYRWFFKAPLWKKIDAETALVSDLRFKSLLLEREGVFGYRVGESLPVGTK